MGSTTSTVCRHRCPAAIYPVLFILIIATSICDAHLLKGIHRRLGSRSGLGSDTGREFLHRLWSTPLALQSPEAERMMRSGLKYELAMPRNWGVLTQKLATPGSKVTVVVYGGSITLGRYQSCEHSSWIDELMLWLEDAFPEVSFNLVNLAHGATTAAVAALCYYHDMPSSADLVLIEYSLNGCGALQCLRPSQPEVAGYENLLRKVIIKAPKAAVMGFATFAWHTEKVTGSRGKTRWSIRVPNPYYNTGEDQHGVIARRYGVPMISARDAMYDVMYNDEAAQRILGRTGDEMMHDNVHPEFFGQRLYGAGLVAWGIRHMVTREVLLKHNPHWQQPHMLLQLQRSRNVIKWQFGSNAVSGGEWHHELKKPLPLPPFVSPLAAKHLDNDTFCTADLDFRGRAVNNFGWSWVDEGRTICELPGCRKWGWMSMKAGASIEFALDTSTVLSKAQVDDGQKLALVILFLRSLIGKTEDRWSGAGMGVAMIECVKGCTCTPLKVDAVNTDRSSELDTARTEISAHPECRIRVTILNETSSGGHKFRINGVALAPYVEAQPLGRFDKLLFDRNYLLVSERYDPNAADATAADAPSLTAAPDTTSSTGSCCSTANAAAAGKQVSYANVLPATHTAVRKVRPSN